MAIRAVTLEPSADIHLVLEPTDRATLPLNVLAHDDTLAAPTSVRDQCTFTIAHDAIAEVSSAGVLTARTEGRTFLMVERTPDSGPTTSLVARVWVHRRIADWWIGNNRASVHVGAADLLLSAYAVFDDGNIGDITGHGYANFFPLGANAIVTPAGRVSGVIVGDVTIRGMLDAIENDVVVTVAPALSAPRLIVEPVRLSGRMDQRRNVLFVAEGFTDRGKFVALVQKVVDRMVSSRLHEPFRILRNDVNYWMAFEPSGENGLTVGPPLNGRESLTLDPPWNLGNLMFGLTRDLWPTNRANLTFYQFVRLVGLPDEELRSATRADADASLQALFPTYQPGSVEQDIFDYWQTWEGDGILQARDSRYGLMYGARLGDRRFTEDAKQADNSWYFHPVPPHSLQPDPRRSAPNLSRWDDGYLELLSSLRTKKGAGDPNHMIGPRWALGGDDQGLVIFLCNDETYGAYGRTTRYSAAAVDLKVHFSQVNFPGIGFDHEPDTSGALIEALVATVTHELAHQFFLGDEYEGESKPLVPGEVASIEFFDNLTTQLMTFTGTPATLDRARIKWNRLIRVARASRLAGPAVNGSGDSVEVPLAPGEGKRWKKGDLAFLRTRNINAAAVHTRYPAYRRHMMHHRGAEVVDVNGDVVTVNGGNLDLAIGEAYPTGSTLYVPKLDKAGDLLRLVLPGVWGMLQAGPLFSKARQCDHAFLGVALPPAIPDVTLTADDWPRVIGLYEGGHRRNCDVFRPAPVCKMRDHLWPRPTEASPRTQRRHFRFCFVCRYTIVNEVNPRRHPELDLLYPGREA